MKSMKKTKQAIDNVRIGHRQYIAEHGEGMPGVLNWKWGEIEVAARSPAEGESA